MYGKWTNSLFWCNTVVVWVFSMSEQCTNFSYDANIIKCLQANYRKPFSFGSVTIRKIYALLLLVHTT